MGENLKGIRDIETRRVFAPYFKSRKQNMENICNDSVFYSLMPQNYEYYYRAYIQQWLEWSSGFVPMLHNSDFFSTGIGYTVCDIFARECMSGGFRVTSTNSGFNDFASEHLSFELTNILSKMFFFSNAGGNAILCLTPCKNAVKPSVIPINRINFEIGSDNTITNACIYNRFVAGKSKTYAKEYRMIDNGEPYYMVELHGDISNITNPSWNSGSTLKTVPDELKSQWENKYGDIAPSVWYRLPKSFDSLGLYNVRNKAVAVALADLPGYSDSSLHTALDILYAIDYNYTQSQMDQYWGKTRVIIPKQYQQVSVSSVNLGKATGSFIEAVNAPLSDDIYSEIPGNSPASMNGETVKPLFIQPNLRAEERKYIRDSDLELLASKVGLSSSTLANHLTYNNSKTATEVHAEQDTTETSVNTKRDLANVAINAMLRDYAKFYGYDGVVTIKWNRSATNTPAQNQQLLSDYQAGTIPIDEYVKRRYPELSEDDVKSWISKLPQNVMEKELYV